jgi:hypothetical protein
MLKINNFKLARKTATFYFYILTQDATQADEEEDNPRRAACTFSLKIKQTITPKTKPSIDCLINWTTKPYKYCRLNAKALILYIKPLKY